MALTDINIAGSPTGRRIPSRDPRFWDVSDWLTFEAFLLDQNRLEEWLGLLSEQLEYRAPVRLTVLRSDGDGVNRSFGHFEETYESMKVRINRVLHSPSSWSEDPPSRTRRFVTNILPTEDSEGRLHVSSYLLVLRSRWDAPDFAFISCERRDVLEPSGELLKLRRRELIFDQSSLGTVNLGLFL